MNDDPQALLAIDVQVGTMNPEDPVDHTVLDSSIELAGETFRLSTCNTTLWNRGTTSFQAILHGPSTPTSLPCRARS